MLILIFIIGGITGGIIIHYYPLLCIIIHPGPWIPQKELKKVKKVHLGQFAWPSATMTR